tara:strand:- start:3366 stop:4064 length:699 start_codon:yes stop_codon:yes gene_type:complete
MKLKIFNICFVLTLFGCIQDVEYKITKIQDKTIEVSEEEDSLINAIILPYKDSIETEMNEVLTYTNTILNKGKPEGTLGNFVTDLCLNYANADICIMNNGGLRTSIHIGEITRGKIYELMPFENELVVLKLNKKDFNEMIQHIIEKGGEPFSGFKLKVNNEKTEIVTPFSFKEKEYIKVLTSDYLANKKEFFKGKKQEKTGLKLRDVIIDYCSKKDTIDIKLDNRFTIKNEK